MRRNLNLVARSFCDIGHRKNTEALLFLQQGFRVQLCAFLGREYQIWRKASAAFSAASIISRSPGPLSFIPHR